MVFLNGDFVAKNEASISVMDRGFLFGDGVYEVIPVYNGQLFRLNKHLDRLQKSLDSIQITNPYSPDQWFDLLTQLTHYSSKPDQSLYLQITRGADIQRKHNFSTLTPTVYIESNPLIAKTKETLEQGFSVITQADIRWSRCDIKATSLLSNILYAQQAKQHQVEEVILFRENFITEGATSNVFMVKEGALFTHPAGKHILSGITRDLVLESAQACKMQIYETPFSIDALMNAEEVWISSSNREVMPIISIDNQPVNHGKAGEHWLRIFEYYQRLKK